MDLQLVKRVATEILCWVNVDGHWVEGGDLEFIAGKPINLEMTGRFRVATESWHSWDGHPIPYFRPDQHLTHGHIIDQALKQRFGTEQRTICKRRITVIYETGNIITEASDLWEPNVGNELRVLAALAHLEEINGEV